MAANYFKKIRKSQVVGVLFSSVLSNLVAFGQPVQIVIDRYCNNEVEFAYNYRHADGNGMEDSDSNDPTHGTIAESPAHRHEMVPSVSVKKSNVFYAKEQLGIIGKSFNADSESPIDNFFNITLPGDIDLQNYNASLSYDLFGLSGAGYTTKSINNNLAYGGKLVEVGREWIQVKENISADQLKKGNNIIFFNRRNDENYQYKIKNLRIEFTQKKEGIVLADALLTNLDGKVYIMGFAPQGVDSITVGNEVVNVYNGIFERVLNVPHETKKLAFTYMTGGAERVETFAVTYRSGKADLNFADSEFGNNSRSYMPATWGSDCIDYDGSLMVTLGKNIHDNAGRLTVEGLTFKDVRPLDADLTNVTAGNYSGYRIKAELHDSISEQVHLRYDPEKIPDGYTVADIKTFYFDKEQLNWKALPVDSLDIENSEIVSRIYDNETDYINGVIKVPESPETGSFTPTMISDMKYADPAAGVVSIAPPTPNSNGGASVSFPLKLPQGRNGMKPSLQITYNSDAGNGLMGIGWNISMPAITLNTKWGAPRFNATNESEMYSLEGEDLVLKAGGVYTAPNRQDNIVRGTGDKVFYTRKEGGFQKIIRHGNSPKTYWWEVIDKNGYRSLYGATATVANSSYIIKNADNNITYWALARVFDPYGNYIEYNYQKQDVVFGPITAKKINLTSIRYSRHDDYPDSYYEIVFYRNIYNYTGGGTLQPRKDISLNARGGYVEIVDDLLTEIKINLKSNGTNSAIRYYHFQYEDKAFQKKQLIWISEHDSNAAEFYRNTLEYYDQSGDGSNLVSNSGTNFGQGYNDNISSFLHDIAGNNSGIVPNGSPLGTSSSTGWSAGLRGGFGIGANVTSINNTVGISGNYSRSVQDTKISFLDINGDGLPDKVYKGSGGIYYRPQTQDGFGDQIEITGIDDLGKTKSRTLGAGVDLRIGVSGASVGAGKSWSWTKSETDNYFTDFNGDGLPDMVAGSRVHFNTTQGSDPLQRHFTDHANDSENAIISGAMDPNLLNDLHLPTMNELREEHSQFDHVTVWRAPYTGTVAISGEGKLTAKNTGGTEANKFRLTIERGDFDDHAADIVATTSTSSPNLHLQNVGQSTAFGNLSNIAVTKGDLIFFRIHNLDYGYGGVVEWNPVINYTDDDDTDDTDSDAVMPGTQIDDNGKNIKHFSAEEDYILNNDDAIVSNSQDTSLSINLNLPAIPAYQFSDDIRFIVKKIRVNSNGDEILNTEVMNIPYDCSNGSTAYTTPVSIGSNATGGSVDSFYFYAESNSNVDWSAIDWQPQLIGNNTGVQYAPVNYKTYDENVRGTKYWFNGTDLPVVNIVGSPIDPYLVVSHNFFTADLGTLDVLDNDEFPLKVNWVTKMGISSMAEYYTKTFYVVRTGSVLGMGIYDFYKKDGSGNFIPLTSAEKGDEYSKYAIPRLLAYAVQSNGGKIFSAFYVSNGRAGLANIDIKVGLHDSQPGSFTPLRLDSPFFAQTPTFLGLMHRGWGQFLYNGGLGFERDEEGEIVNLGAPIPYYGPIDVTLLDFQSQAQNSQNMEGMDEDDLELGGTNTSVRYSLYKQAGETRSYRNDAIINTLTETSTTYAGYGLDNGKLIATLGRFGEPSLEALYIDSQDVLSGGGDVIPAFRQRSKSKGTAVTGDFGSEVGGGSGTTSEATSEVLNQYIDLNGDRYPDIVTSGRIQYTGMLGGLSSTTLQPNDFISGDNSNDRTYGLSLPTSKPNSTESANAETVENKTRTNISSGISGSQSNGTSSNSRQWIDMNGDGLTDKVHMAESGITVQLNTGYGFTPEIIWAATTNLVSSTRTSGSAGVSFNYGASFAAGFGASTSTANMQTIITDVTGDGLPDLLFKAGTQYSYFLNTGTKFDPLTLKVFYNGSLLETDYSVSGNIFASYTYGFPITLPFIILKVVFSGSGSANGSFNEKRATLCDLNGDGFIDVIKKASSTNNTTIAVSYNKIGKTHLLKQVNLPMGGYWKIDYNRSVNSYDMPQSKWLLTKIETNDGFEGDNAYKPDATLTTASYENPKYDRRERESLGFGLVVIEQREPNGNLYRAITKMYHNDNIYLKGMEKGSIVTNNLGQVVSKEETLFNLLDPETPVVNLNASAEHNYLQANLIANEESLLDHSRLFVAIARMSSISYEGAQGLGAVKEITSYNNAGSVLSYVDYGEGGSDAYKAEIEYYGETEMGSALLNGKSFPKKISVKRNSDNVLLRQRTATYTSQGKPAMITTKLNATEDNRVSMEYDAYGNTTSVHQLDNLNAVGDHFKVDIAYDDLFRTYPVSVTNAFGETSTSLYDYKFGIPVLTTDVNGQKMRTRIDRRGRVIEITGPNELALEGVNGNNGAWTIRMTYKGESALSNTLTPTSYTPLAASGSFIATPPGSTPSTTSQHYALTRHFDPEYASLTTNATSTNHILTISIVDGLGQPIQVKKTHVSGATNVKKWMVSGFEEKDAFGRTLKSYLPTVEGGNYPSNMSSGIVTTGTSQSTFLRYFSVAPSLLPDPVKMTYDVKDRVKSVQKPGDSEITQMTYGIEDGMFFTKSELEDQTNKVYTDIRGRQRKMVQNDEYTTTMEYNAVNELTRVIDNGGFVTETAYDLAGRKTEMKHPDRGTVTFKYDKAGRMTEQSNSNLIDDGQKIRYYYDFGRLIRIEYPQNTQNEVKYTYGAVGDPLATAENAVGRLLQQEDATGIQVFGYGKMGEVTKNLRSVAVAGYTSYWFLTQWKYDSWNRVQEIIYPDQEKVIYNYNVAGMLQRINSEITNVSSTLLQDVVKSITYNDYGERLKMVHGNNTETNYNYDVRRRMSNLSHSFTGFSISKTYEYDLFSNISKIKTDSPENSLPGTDGLGGPVTHEYKYDNYNRLILATGSYTGPNDQTTPYVQQRYELRMDYNDDHTIKKKTQTQYQGLTSSYGGSVTQEIPVYKNSYIIDYEDYGIGYKPHAPRKITESPSWITGLDEQDPRIRHKEISYDANGNQLEIKEKVGETDVKLRKNLWDEENRLAAVDLKPDDAKAHPIAIYTYDAGGQRVVRYNYDRLDVYSNASYTGHTSKDNVMLYPSGLLMGKAYHDNDRGKRADLIRYTKHYYAGSERLSAKTGTLKLLGLYPSTLLATVMPQLNSTAVRGLSTTTVSDAQANVTRVHDTFNIDPPSLSPSAGDNLPGVTHDSALLNIYYFHPDHLGSSSYITNKDGVITQHMEYLPFGETLVDEHRNSFNSPFKYNGKEFDEETGNYYYGARYYDPKWSIFISVDPMAESTGDAYGYCYQNPIKLVDPTGMSAVDGVDPASQPVVNQIKLDIENKLCELQSTREGITTSATNEQGKVNYSRDQRKQVEELDFRINSLQQTYSNIEAIEADTEFTFKLSAVPAGSSSADLVPTFYDVANKTYTINYFTGDTGNIIHEFGKHAFQIMNGDVVYSFTKKLQLSATYSNKQDRYDLEVQAYLAQYSYDGKLNTYHAPMGEDTHLPGYGTEAQVNTRRETTNSDQITRGFVKSMMTGPTGNTKVYPK